MASTDTLFTPYVTVTVDEGVVTGVDIDWADTLMNTWENNAEGHNEVELWNNSSPSSVPEPENQKIACAFLDSKEVRQAIDTAFNAVLYGLK